MLWRTLPISLALALFLPLLLRADDPPPALDKDLLDGKWESTSVVIDGDKGYGEFFVTILIEHDKVALTE